MGGKSEGKGINKSGNPLKRLSSINELGILIALIVLCVLLGLTSPVFFRFDNVMNVLRQISLVAIMAVGEAFVIITGGDRPFRRKHDDIGRHIYCMADHSGDRSNRLHCS